MPEKDDIYSSIVKYNGVFNFRDFYAFCYEWLIDETGLGVFEESLYEEKVEGTKKKLKIEWKGNKKMTDYFRMDIKVKFEITDMEDVEVNQGGVKAKMNKGTVKTTMKGILVKDYQGKFETNGFQKFLRGIYEKWIIPARIDDYEEKVADKCDKFLGQVKAYLALEGKR